MEMVMQLLKSDTFIIIYAILGIVLFVGFIVLLYKVKNLNNRYKKFMKKLGNGKDIQQDLENYMYRVEKVEKQNAEVLSICNNLEKDISDCIQKVGIVRYNAFQDTGSDLSFALAMLDEKNTGVVLNGIYSREMSNIYAKPIKEGKSTYALSEEEKQALEKAISSKEVYNVRKI